MVSVVADNRDIERALFENLALARRAGAVVSDGLQINCIDGNLSIEAPSGWAGRSLIALPRDYAIPIGHFELSIADDAIVVSSHTAMLPSHCVAAMEKLLELYNLAGKLAQHRRTSPWPFLAAHPSSWRYVSPRLADDLRQMFSRFLASGNTDELALKSFFHSRVYDLRSTPDASPSPVLLPLIELLNHHLQGAPIELTGNPGEPPSLTVKRSIVSGKASSECFAFYGLYDSFDTWMSYGFIDETAPFVRSVPMTIELPGLGTIRLANFVRHRAREELAPAAVDLYPFIPKLLARKGNHIDIASLLLPGRWAPEALRRTLCLLIRELDPGHPRPRDLAVFAEQQVAAANEAFYRDLLAFLGPLQPRSPAQRAVREEFARVCNLQLARVRYHAGGIGG